MTDYEDRIRHYENMGIIITDDMRQALEENGQLPLTYKGDHIKKLLKMIHLDGITDFTTVMNTFNGVVSPATIIEELRKRDNK